jgi:hypothetical protein
MLMTIISNFRVELFRNIYSCLKNKDLNIVRTLLKNANAINERNQEAIGEAKSCK